MTHRSPPRSSHFSPLLASIASTLLLLAPSMPATASDPEIEALKDMVRVLQQEVATLKTMQAQAPINAVPVPRAAVGHEASPSTGSAAPGGGVKFYGALDSGVEWVSKVGSNHANLTRIPSTTGSVPSRLGVDFEHALRPGLKGIARAEMGLSLDNGASGQGGRLFGRQLYVGLDSDYGSVTLGRQYSMLFYSLLNADLLGPNIYSLGSIDAYIPNARFDNSIAWRGKFGDLTLGASYSLGRDTVANTVPATGVCAGEEAASVKCRAWSGIVKYDTARFGVGAGIDQQFGGNGATASFMNGAPALPFSSSSDTDTRLTINAYGHWASLKLGIGGLNRQLKTSAGTVRQQTSWLQAAYPLTPQFIVDGGLFRVRNDDQERAAQLYVLRGVYSFDQQLAAYLSLGHIDNSSKASYGLSAGGFGAAPAAGWGQNGVMAGLRYRF